MSDLMELWQVAAEELAAWCDTSTTRDVETLRGRVSKEGESFLTITLPTYASDLEKALAQGQVSSDLWTGFGRKGGLPAFLSGFLRRVFNSADGLLLDAPCIDSIFAIRQLTLMFKKIELPCSPKRMRAARDAFVSCEMELKQLETEWTRVFDPEFSRLALLVFGDVFDEVEREIAHFELTPRHGPGKTADKKVGNQKWIQSEWTDRLEPYFPYGEYVAPSWRYLTDAYNDGYDMAQIRFLKPSEERPVRVRFVPKTLKAPRVIAVEPTAMQYSQQALMQSLVPKLEGMTPSSYFVGFTDQERNRALAREGSITGTLATLDLSEASDRVLNSLVLELFRLWPHLNGAVQACRTRTAELDDGLRIRLSKFASMGSALCFPVEAMVFTTLALMGIQDARNTPLTKKGLTALNGQVRVYGDDIIVPVDCVPYVIARLEAFGLKVNHSKSFWSGKFRESCGGDYYDGEDVKPVRVTRVAPVTRQDAEEALAWVAMSNAFHTRGMWRTADAVKRRVQRAIGPLPCLPGRVIDPEEFILASKGLGYFSFTGTSAGTRWDPKLHRSLVRTWITDAPIPASPLDGVFALRKSLSADWSDPLYRDHLKRAGRPLSVNIKRGWVPTTG